VVLVVVVATLLALVRVLPDRETAVQVQATLRMVAVVAVELV
jgi:hypothetical protein